MADRYSLGRRGTNTGTVATSLTDDANLGGRGATEGIDAGCAVLIESGTRAGDIVQLSTRPALTTGLTSVDPSFGGVLNANATTLNGVITAAATSIVLTSVSLAPPVPYVIKIESEYLYVSAQSGTTLTVTRGYLNSVAASHADTTAVTFQDAYMLLYKPLRFIGGGNALRDRINQALAMFGWEKRIVPITLVADGDMLASGTTSWSEVGSGALSKVAGTFPLGGRVLRMTGVAANDYIKSATVAVEPETAYYLEVTGMIASIGAAADTGTLVLYDETNAAAIALDNTTIDRFEPETLINTVTMPAGCKQVTVRLEADNAGDIIDWSTVIFRKASAQEFVLTDRPQKALWIGRLLYPTTDSWATRGDFREVRSETEQRDAGVWVIRTSQSVSGLSLWYEEIVKPAALTAHTDATPIPLDDLCAVAAELLLRPLRLYSVQYAGAYEHAARDAAGVITAYRQRNQVVVNQGRAAYPMVRV